jgi:hypothetical protein
VIELKYRALQYMKDKVTIKYQMCELGPFIDFSTHVSLADYGKDISSYLSNPRSHTKIIFRSPKESTMKKEKTSRYALKFVIDSIEIYYKKLRQCVNFIATT